MRVDLVNNMIRDIQPVLQRISVDYEREKFQNVLEKTPSRFKNINKVFVTARLHGGEIKCYVRMYNAAHNLLFPSEADKKKVTFFRCLKQNHLLDPVSSRRTAFSLRRHRKIQRPGEKTWSHAWTFPDTQRCLPSHSHVGFLK